MKFGLFGCGGRITFAPSFLPERDLAVSSLIGVLGITVILFFVVAITARLILGK
jgi:hypothetical protein